MERRKIDDQQLTHDGAPHGVEEHAVGEETDGEERLALEGGKGERVGLKED